MGQWRFMIVLIIAALIVHKGETLKCWMCQSNAPDGLGCGDPFLGSTAVKDDSMFIRDCDQQTGTRHLQLLPNGTTHEQKINPGLKFYCLKLTGKLLGVKVVLRGCATGLPNITQGSCMGSEPQKTTGGNILTCDACAGDLCNRAANVGAATIGVLCASLLLTLM